MCSITVRMPLLFLYHMDGQVNQLRKSVRKHQETAFTYRPMKLKRRNGMAAKAGNAPALERGRDALKEWEAAPPGMCTRGSAPTKKQALKKHTREVKIVHAQGRLSITDALDRRSLAADRAGVGGESVPVSSPGEATAVVKGWRLGEGCSDRQYVCLEIPDFIRRQLLDEALHGREYTSVNHSGAPRETESARLTQAALPPSCPSVVAFKKWLADITECVVTLRVTKALAGGTSPQQDHVDSLRVADGKHSKAVGAIRARREDGLPPAYIVWLPLRGAASIRIQAGAWGRDRGGVSKPPPMAPMKALEGHMLLMRADCVHAGMPNMATSIRFHSYVFEHDEKQGWGAVENKSEPEVRLV